MRLTGKQEKFCQKVAEGLSYSDAYRAAYDAKGMKAETVHKRASELLENGEVTGRISELQKKTQKRHEETVDDILNELDEARKLALEMGQASAAVSASMNKAKLLGLDVDSAVILAKEPIKIEVVK